MADAAGLNQALSTVALVQLQLEQRSFDWTLWPGSTSAATARGHSIDPGRHRGLRSSLCRPAPTPFPGEQSHHLDQCLFALPPATGTSVR